MKITQTLKQTGAYIRKVYNEIPDTYGSAKGQKLESVQGIVVSITVDGNEVQFDGDEVSQNRLHRAYTVAKEKNITIPWKTYNNDMVMLNKDAILDILHKAGVKQTELWF